MPLKYTRQIVDEISKGTINNYKKTFYPFLCSYVPDMTSIPRELLYPYISWKNQQKYYDDLKDLVNKFNKHFVKSYGKDLLDELSQK